MPGQNNKTGLPSFLGPPTHAKPAAAIMTLDPAQGSDGTYGTRHQERVRLEHEGLRHTGKTDSSHILPYRVTYPHPLPDRESDDGVQPRDRGIAYIELSAVHGRQIDSFKDEKSEGFDKKEHGWNSPAEFRNHLRALLDDTYSKFTKSNISNAMQLGFLDIGHVRSNDLNAHPHFGLHQSSANLRASLSSLVHAIKSNPRVGFAPYFQNHSANPIKNFQDDRIQQSRLTPQGQIEVVLAAREAFTGKPTNPKILDLISEKDEFDEKHGVLIAHDNTHEKTDETSSEVVTEHSPVAVVDDVIYPDLTEHLAREASSKAVAEHSPVAVNNEVTYPDLTEHLARLELTATGSVSEGEARLTHPSSPASSINGSEDISLEEVLRGLSVTNTGRSDSRDSQTQHLPPQASGLPNTPWSEENGGGQSTLRERSRDRNISTQR